MTWNDFENIAVALVEQNPKLDPLTVRFTDLHKMVTSLDGFDDDPGKSNEAKLEAIQMTWHEEFTESQYSCLV